MNRRLAVRAIVMHEGELLCVRLKPYDEAITGDYWCLPGGTVEHGEALIPALEREILEETGIKCRVSNLLYIQQFVHKDTDTLELFFHVINAEDFLTIELTKTSHGNTEIEEITFVDPKTTNILPKFLTTEPIEDKIAQSGAVSIFPVD